ncbi:MAG: diguanylate cyclase [Anaerostipes sp.]|nr:diguanylate cyclase [Anaerostipes sp.]
MIKGEQPLTELALKNDKLREYNAVLEKQLKESRQKERQYQSLFHNAPAGYLVFDQHGQITDANLRFCSMVSVPFKDRYKMNIEDLIQEEDRQNFRFMIRQLLGKKQTCSMEARLSADGEIFHVIITVNRYEDPQVSAGEDSRMLFAGIITEVSKLKKEQQIIKDKSMRDCLTGLYNRTFYSEYLSRRGKSEDLPISAAILDLDRLKMINDSLGHTFGDRAIITVTKVLKQYAKEKYIFARIGGDEIAAFFPDTELSEAEAFLKKAEAQVAKYSLSGIRLSFSWGCAEKSSPDQDLHTVLSAAEDMMYRKKFRNSTVKKSETLDVILNALFNRNPNIHKHSLRMSRLLERFGTYLGLEPERISFLQGLGYVHDIGMASISDEILNKHGSLTKSERREVNRHPETGYRILKSVPDMEREAQIVLYHHENWDGSGYPYGLSGDSIPVESRMVLILDTYDRMKYAPFGRRRFSEDEIVRELERWSGIQFDPFLAGRFIEWLEDRKKQL